MRSRIPLVVAAATLLLHIVTNARDGIFRDEMYYLACADHLDWGYVDQPPLSIAALWAWRGVFGDSLAAIRLLPALMGALLVLLAARLSRDMGGGTYAQGLAALSVGMAPLVLGITGIYSMNAFDLVLWALLALAVVRLARTQDPRHWIVLGALFGLGLLNKINVLFFAFGLALALPFTPLRRHLRRPQPWLGALLALALFAPHLVWQATHGWPTAEFIRNAKEQKIVALSPVQFFLAQIPEIHPFNLPLWLAGLAWLLLGAGRRFRALGIVYVVALVVMSLQRSKPYYLGPAYTMLLAAGAVAAEDVLRRVWARRAVAGVLALGGAAIAPFAVPVLPVEAFLAYQRALGREPRTDENQRLGPLPQFYADRFGWEELAATVASVYHALPPEERTKALIVTSNYGEAGAIDYFGRRYGLPRASSQHNSYYLWGPTHEAPEVVITVGMDPEGPAQALEEVTEAARFSHPYAMPYETRNPILVCRRFKLPLWEAWRRGKHFI